MLLLHEEEEILLEIAHPVDGHLLQQAVGAAEDDGHLLFDGHGAVLRLLEHLDVACAFVEHRLGGGIEVGAELGESLQLAILGLVHLQRAGDLLHRLDLRLAADARHRNADIDGGAYAAVEEVGLKEYLAVGDGDDVGGDIGRHVACLGLDDGQGGEGATTFDTALEGCRQVVHLGGNGVVLDDACGTLQEAAVEVEDVAGVGLASRWATEEQRNLAVGHGLLGEVVVDDEGVAARVAEVFADGGTGEGGVELHGGRRGSRGGDDDGILKGAFLLQVLHQVGHGAALLAAGHIDAIDGVAGVVIVALVDDGVYGYGRLAGLAVADDELALAATDGDHGVDGLDAGLQGLLDGLAEDDAGGLALEGHVEELACYGAFTVDGLAYGVDDTTQESFADRDGGYAARALHGVAFVDGAHLAEHDNADVVFFEVLHYALVSVVKLDEFAALGVAESVDTGDAVADGEHGADLFELGVNADIGQLFLKDCRYFGRFYI